MAYGEFLLEEITITFSDGQTIPVTVQLPPHYNPKTAWPLMLAMQGGPPGSVQQAHSGAGRMLRVWKEAAADSGWIVASPAMTTVVTASGRTEERLPYEILHAEQIEKLLDTAAGRYRIDPNRIVLTGISLGSNFSIAFACARPDRPAAIFPVSTEGDSREHLLRNLQPISVYILEGTKDPNIRHIDGPRALHDILTSFGYDITYREFGDRAHEGFQEYYADVLRWLSDRPRDVYPREVLRVPHSAIAPVSRRIHWVEADTRQALIHAKIPNPHRIDITARWTRELTLYLHDRLVDLDQPVEVWVNGEMAEKAKIDRSVPFALEQVKRLNDPERIYAGSVTVRVPQTQASVAAGKALWESLAPTHAEGTMSFWEMYAVRALEERFPSLGMKGEEISDPASLGLEGESTGIRVTEVAKSSALGKAGVRVGDILVEVGDEPFYVGRGGLSFLHSWLMRELRGESRAYPIIVWRDGDRVELTANLALRPYREPTSFAPSAERARSSRSVAQ